MNSTFWRAIKKMSDKEWNHMNFESLIIYMLIAAILIHLIIIIYSRITGKRITILREIIIQFAVMYGIFIVDMTVLSRTVIYDDLFVANAIASGQNQEQKAASFLNIIFFIPWGFILMFVQKSLYIWKRVLMTACYSFLTSLAVELCQLITQRGYFEFNDLEMNLAGGVVGAMLALLIIQLRKHCYNRQIMNHNKSEEKENAGQE